jgi:hypothetical protein
MIGIVEVGVQGIVGTDGSVKNHQGIGSILALAGTTNDCSALTALTVLTIFTDLSY